MRRHETRRALRALRDAWPALRLGPGELDRWELDLGLHDVDDVLAAIDARSAAGAPAPSSTVDLFSGATSESDRLDQVEDLVLWPIDQGATT